MLTLIIIAAIIIIGAIIPIISAVISLFVIEDGTVKDTTRKFYAALEKPFLAPWTKRSVALGVIAISSASALALANFYDLPTALSLAAWFTSLVVETSVTAKGSFDKEEKPIPEGRIIGLGIGVFVHFGVYIAMWYFSMLAFSMFFSIGNSALLSMACCTAVVCLFFTGFGKGNSKRKSQNQ